MRINPGMESRRSWVQASCIDACSLSVGSVKYRGRCGHVRPELGSRPENLSDAADEAAATRGSNVKISILIVSSHIYTGTVTRNYTRVEICEINCQEEKEVSIMPSSQRGIPRPAAELTHPRAVSLLKTEAH